MHGDLLDTIFSGMGGFIFVYAAMAFAVPIALFLIWFDRWLRDEHRWIAGTISYTDCIIAGFAIISVVVATMTYESVKEYTTITLETFEATNRPYVRIEVPTDKDIPALSIQAEAQRVCVTFEVINEGSVPSYDLTMSYQLNISGNQIAGDLKHQYLGPHGGYHYFFQCSGNPTAYRIASDSVTRNTNTLSVDLSVTADYESVSKKKYHYYAQTSYDNVMKHFVITEEGETEESP